MVHSNFETKVRRQDVFLEMEPSIISPFLRWRIWSLEFKFMTFAFLYCGPIKLRSIVTMALDEAGSLQQSVVGEGRWIQLGAGSRYLSYTERLNRKR